MVIMKNEYEEQEYQQFLSYVRGTWRSLLDGDWKDEPSIDKVIIYNYKNTFEVFVYLKGNPVYYTLENFELKEVEYDGKAIKTEYTLNSDIILYSLLKGSFIRDLGLDYDVELKMFDFVDGLEINEDLTKDLQAYQDIWAESMYCTLHDL